MHQIYQIKLWSIQNNINFANRNKNTKKDVLTPKNLGNDPNQRLIHPRENRSGFRVFKIRFIDFLVDYRGLQILMINSEL